MKIEKINILHLKPAEYNPRKDLKLGDSEYENIKKSIEHFGYISPIIINKDWTIIGGHQRLKVLIDLGYDEVDCVVVDLNKNDEKALNIALNKITGEWDMQKLSELLTDINTVGLADITGFSSEELNKLIFGDEEKDVIQDNFDIEEAIKAEPITKMGDIWVLGKHKIICGDSTNEIDKDILLGNEKVDLVITDPPYNIDYEGSNGLKIQNDNMEQNEFYNFLLKVYKTMYDASKVGTPIYVFHADTEGANFRRALVEAGYKYSQCLVWVKNAMTLGRQDYQWRHESILYGWKEGAKHYFVSDRDQTTVVDDGYPDTKGMSTKELRAKLRELIDFIYKNNTIIYEDKPSINDIHPTMKPLKLIAKLMHNSSQVDELVFDPFLGSGSTLITAEQLNRICYGIELDERYCDAIVKRYAEFKKGTSDIYLIRNAQKIAYKNLI